MITHIFFLLCFFDIYVVKDDQLELQLLRTQRKDMADLMEENCALRQQLGNMERKFRTMRLRETSAETHTEMR